MNKGIKGLIALAESTRKYINQYKVDTFIKLIKTTPNLQCCFDFSNAISKAISEYEEGSSYWERQ
jgi:hypothetical protein